MNRRPQKMISQGLVVVLICFVALAFLAYANRPAKPQPTAQPTAAGPTTAPTVAIDAGKPAPQTSGVLKTETPTGLAAQPISPAGNAVARNDSQRTGPSTQPVAQAKQSWDQLVPQDKSQPKLIPLVNVATAPEDAKKQMQSGDVLAARQSLNAMLLAGNLSEAQTADLKKQISDLNQTIIFSTKRFPNDPYGGTYAVQNGDALQKIAKAHNLTWELLGRMNDISDPRKLRAGRSIKVINGPFHAVVSKSKFEMEIWLGEPMSSDSMYITTFHVGLGKEGSTPTGTWVVTAGGKMKNPKFWGAADLPPMEADDPQNPLGEYWLALTGVDGQAEGREGFGIHGTIDPSSIGKNASHGCVRLKADDIAMVYEILVDAKSKVIVKD